jgi:hypothetical protein
MPASLRSQSPDPSLFASRIEELRLQLKGVDPQLLATRTGSAFKGNAPGEGYFHLELWGRSIQLSYPAFQASYFPENTPLPEMSLALLLYYFLTADGSPPTERWISFAELPDGRFYNHAFQGYTGKELEKHFGNHQAQFERAAQQIGGCPFSFGNAAFTFRALPRIQLLAVFWQGDEDFPASFQILFDACASHYLPTDAYAILGSALTRRLIQAAGI